MQKMFIFWQSLACLYAHELPDSEIALNTPMPQLVAEKHELQEQQRRLSEELNYEQNSGNATRSHSELSETLMKVERRLAHHE